jgi:4-hydroxybenzoate polyprenyltransferase
MQRLRAAIRVIHPAPASAVVLLSAALATILAIQHGRGGVVPIALVVAAVAGSQVFTGALNDWADRERDRAGRRDKPIPAGELSADVALGIAGAGLAVQVAASAVLGPLPLLLGLGASAAAAAYDLWLSRTPFSVIPYLIAFGLLPLWIAAGIGVPLERVAPASLLVAPFAAAAHLANTLRDFDADALAGSDALAQRLGRRRAHRLALVLAAGVGLAGGWLLLVAEAPTGALALGAVGLAAVLSGYAGPERLWRGILVAAVTWTAAWALATG